MVTDPISDMLTRIRNAVAVGHARVSMPASNVKVGIAQIRVAEGFIDRFELGEVGAHSQLELVLRYGEKRRPAIEGIKRISKPGHRVYRGAGELPRVQGGIGVAVVSTSQGLLPDREARRRRLGGEVLCEVW
jgi:small subunit ribosomal protein S8